MRVIRFSLRETQNYVGLNLFEVEVYSKGNEFIVSRFQLFRCAGSGRRHVPVSAVAALVMVLRARLEHRCWSVQTDEINATARGRTVEISMK